MGIPRFVIFFVVVSLVLFAASFYLGRRVKQSFGLSVRAERTGLFVVLGAMASMILARALGVRLLGEVAFTLLLALLISTGLLLLVDLAKLGALPFTWLASRAKPEPAPRPEPEPALALATELAAPAPAPAAEPAKAEPAPEKGPVLPTRRVFLGQAVTGSALLVGSGSSFYGAVFGRHDYVIEEVPVRIPGLSKRLDGYTLVQLSDIHFGTFVGDAEMRAAEELVRKARPDRIVLTGDLLDNDAKYAEMLGRFVRNIAPLARDGVVAIPGNHDWYAGIDEVVSALKAAGARVLRNDGFVVGDDKDGFALLGVEDVWARRLSPGNGPNLEAALTHVPKDLPRVLLCHNPVFFPDAAGQVALQLSGHTHGGQVNLGALQPGKLVLPYGYVAGLYERNGSRLWVNRGFGTAGPPARVGAPPEVTRVVLVSA
ncbi:metallophosphoesterase [Polyangium sp. 15x6]|uniref:metallophosphoesterase n=1 Tax=Polyangium sp. 15x6 TaxID=3042687 RepID=UPI00249B81E7|nr:metallophosphoesterase [Polyangium sp. 15x6]MDI3290065.1 metallophosphoesterase [Polyangium sp. 15x6]